MADTTFVDKVTRIIADWLNPVNKAVYRGIGAGGVAPETPAEVRTNLGLSSTGTPSGGALIGNNTGGGSLGANVQEALDLKANLTDVTDVTHQKNDWDDANTANDAQQTLEYTNTALPVLAGRDWGCWVGYVHNQGTNWNNLTPLVGHSYHDATFDNLSGACWGVVTEAWSNTTNYTTLVGAEFATIARDPQTAAPSVGMNSVFKNRLDGVTTLPAGDTLYNRDSSGILITSQNRPATGNTSAGSGWQTAIRVGDLGFGSGLDWEGGSGYPGSSTYKAYSTIIDVTNALTDLAGGYPWFVLQKNSLTYWGMRFNGVLSGSLDTNNIVVNAGGAGYAIGDQGTIGAGGAKYQVADVAAGAVTKIAILAQYRGSGYGAAAGVATAVTTGAGNGALTVDISLAEGYTFGGDTSLAAGGAGYAVNDIATVNGCTAGYIPLAVKVTTVAAGVVTGYILITSEATGTGGIRTSLGRGYTTGAHATTNVISTGAGLQISIDKTYTDGSLGGEKWEFWRMSNPSNPTATGSRDSFIDAGYPPLSRSVGSRLNDSYSAAVIQAITPSSVPTLSMVGTNSTELLTLASTDPMWSGAAAGAYAGKIAIKIDGVTKYITVTA